MTTTPAMVPGAVRFLIFSASLRSGSLNTRLAQHAARVVREHGGSVDLASMADFSSPWYNHDVQTRSGITPGAEALRRRLEGSDAFIIASPEYNASMPGDLKDLIDWTSRFRPQPFNEKQALLLSASPSMAGGNRGLWALRVPLEHLGARVYPDMFSLAQAHEAFDAQGAIRNPELGKRFSETLLKFMELVEAAKHYPCAKRAWVEFLGEHPDAPIDRVEIAR